MAILKSLAECLKERHATAVTQPVAPDHPLRKRPRSQVVGCRTSVVGPIPFRGGIGENRPDAGDEVLDAIRSLTARGTGPMSNLSFRPEGFSGPLEDHLSGIQAALV